MKKLYFVLILSLFFIFSFIFQIWGEELRADIKIDKQVYSVGEKVKFQVLLLKGEEKISREIEVYFYDNSKKKIVKKKIISNKEEEFEIKKEYPAGYWKIEAVIGQRNVTKLFIVKEKEEVKFFIENDVLIIENTGNVPYRREVQIKIGEKIITQKQNIPVGGKKRIKLIAPEGIYDIEVCDEKNIYKKEKVHLRGTGRVIGALEESFRKGSTLGGARGPEASLEIFSPRYFLPLVFLVSVFGVTILLLLEKRLRKKVVNAEE